MSRSKLLIHSEVRMYQPLCTRFQSCGAKFWMDIWKEFYIELERWNSTT